MYSRKTTLKYLSVCSGIEAATVAWHNLGWKPIGFSEIEPFPSQVLAHHYPDVPNYGDMTNFKEWNVDETDVLVGGTPCQSFSVAGLQKGLDDPRGNLSLIYCGMLKRFQPRWFVWENVPGVLFSNKGRDFGAFLGAVAELGYGFAYRVLDAQYFGVAQRRRRVFVVGHFGDWRPATSVLFERESLRGDTAPSRKAEGEVTRITESGVALSCEPVAHCLQTSCHDYSRADGFNMIAEGNTIRKLTPIECERLQGFPDNYTQIAWRDKSADQCPDSHRYKALGNSMAVPVMRWVGKNIQKLV